MLDRIYPLTMDFFAWHLVVDAVLVTGIVGFIVYKNRSKIDIQNNQGLKMTSLSIYFYYKFDQLSKASFDRILPFSS